VITVLIIQFNKLSYKAQGLSYIIDIQS